MSPTLLSPEESLLFRLAAPPALASGAVRSLVARRIDWERFVALVDQERVAGSAWRDLSAMEIPIPPEIAEQLQFTAALSDFRLLAVRQLLERTVAALSSAGIEVLLVKGAALASFVYRDPCDRNMSDLDLVLPADRIREGADIAGRIGWSIDGMELKAALYEEHHHLPPMSDTLGLDIRLEIHSDVLPHGHPLRFGVSEMWSRAVKRPLGQATVLVPSTEDLLLHSCVHLGWSHEMRGGAWRTFRDVSELIAQPSFSPERFFSIARERTVAGSCYWTLRLASLLSGAPVPPQMLTVLQPRLPGWLRELVERHLILECAPLSRRSPSVSLARFLWTVAMRPAAAGHGGTRPWQHVERKMEKSIELGLPSPSASSYAWWQTVDGIRDTVTYLRRLAAG